MTEKIKPGGASVSKIKSTAVFYKIVIFRFNLSYFFIFHLHTAELKLLTHFLWTYVCVGSMLCRLIYFIKFSCLVLQVGHSS